MPRYDVTPATDCVRPRFSATFPPQRRGDWLPGSRRALESPFLTSPQNVGRIEHLSAMGRRQLTKETERADE